jgi:site-specific DNA recombinase
MESGAIYVRISSDRDGTRAGVSRQIEDCKAWAVRNGSQVAEVYEDNDVSAYRGKVRPAYRRMCDDLKHGTRDGVIAWHPDRLHRNVREIEDFIDLIEATGAQIATVTGGDYDLTTTTGRAMIRVSGVFARMESEDKSRRIKRSAEQQAKDGKRSGGGTRAYGYAPGHAKVIRAEANVITDAAKRILAGENLRSICTELNDRAIRTVTGAQWSTTTLKAILTSARISGQRDYHGEIVATGDWPAIVTPATTLRLRGILNDPSRRTNRAPRSYPLTGLVCCGKCGAKMVARPKADGRRQYVCVKGPGFHGCGGMAVLAEPMEEIVNEAILIRLDSPVIHRALTKPSTNDGTAEALLTQIAEDRDQLDDLAKMWSRKEISAREWSAAKQPILDRIQEAERSVGSLTSSSALDGFTGDPDALRRQWADLPPARQRAIASVLLDRLIVNAATRGRNTFDPDRIEPIWKA